MDLPKYKQNTLLEAIQKAEMEPEDFDFNVGAEDATLRHTSSGASFVLSGDVGYDVRRVAGDASIDERTGLSWYRVEEQIALWLSDVKGCQYAGSMG